MYASCPSFRRDAEMCVPSPRVMPEVNRSPCEQDASDPARAAIAIPRRACEETDVRLIEKFPILVRLEQEDAHERDDPDSVDEVPEHGAHPHGAVVVLRVNLRAHE